MAQLVLLPGKDRSLARRHPWIFAAAVDRLSGRARPAIRSRSWRPTDGLWRKRRGVPSRKSALGCGPSIRQETVDDAFFKRRIQAAVDRRR
jgi:23S rRNA (cytosine1962-C5)-methyltransferase